MLHKDNQISFGLSFAQVAALAVAFGFGFWSVGVLTGLIAAALGYVDQRIDHDVMDLAVVARVSAGAICAAVAIVSLHILFPASSPVEEVTRILAAYALGACALFVLERK